MLCLHGTGTTGFGPHRAMPAGHGHHVVPARLASGKAQAWRRARRTATVPYQPRPSLERGDDLDEDAREDDSRSHRPGRHVDEEHPCEGGEKDLNDSRRRLGRRP